MRHSFCTGTMDWPGNGGIQNCSMSHHCDKFVPNSFSHLMILLEFNNKLGNAPHWPLSWQPWHFSIAFGHRRPGQGCCPNSLPKCNLDFENIEKHSILGKKCPLQKLYYVYFWHPLLIAPLVRWIDDVNRTSAPRDTRRPPISDAAASHADGGPR